MTFRVRTALVVLALTAFTMGTAFAIVWQHFVASQREQLDRALLDVAHFEANDAAAGHLEFTDAPGPSANAVGPLPKYGVLFTSDGKSLTHTDNLRSLPPLPQRGFEDGFDLDHESIHMRGVIVAVPGTDMRILLATTRNDLENRANVLARAMAIAFAVGCAWAALVAFGVASRLTRDHDAIAEVARSVASGDVSARVTLTSPHADLHRLARDLNAMIDRLVGLLGSQERFIAHAAHELRTPLTAIRIEIEHALSKGKDRAELEEAMRGALDSVRKLSSLADDLLTLARAGAHPIEGETEVSECIGDAVRLVSPIGAARQVLIVVDATSTTVQGQHTQVVRILRNVLENAVHFAPRESVVHVRVTTGEDSVRITITDDGPGVDPAENERIFEPFTQLPPKRSEGTGLGLSIARELARSMGGELAAESGVGGRFHLSLRVAHREA